MIPVKTDGPYIATRSYYSDALPFLTGRDHTETRRRLLDVTRDLRRTKLAAQYTESRMMRAVVDRVANDIANRLDSREAYIPIAQQEPGRAAA